MNKKILLQLLFLSIAIILCLIIYKIYFEKEKKISDLSEDNNKSFIQNDDSNIIKNLEYLSYSASGNKYKILAEEGSINNSDPDLINMTNVTAEIYISDLNPIIITSKYAKYNSQNYDTHFFDNVNVDYIDHKIICKNLNFLFEKNLAIFSDSIIYTNLQTKIEADRLEIDLITKNSKIFMNDESKKIKALVIN
jgi:hypothetical protein